MTTDKKTPGKRSAKKPSVIRKNRAAVKKNDVEPAATRQKAGMAKLTQSAKKVAKKSEAKSKPLKVAKAKPVRDDFKMPAEDYALIQALKQRALEFDRPTRKNELLRAGLRALGAMDNAALQQHLMALGRARTGMKSGKSND